MCKKEYLFLTGCILLMMMAGVIPSAGAATPDPKIRKKLLENYDPMAQPFPAGFARTTTVTMSSLNVIHYNIDDLQQTLEIHAWISMSWHDERLRWSQYFRDHRGYLHFKKSEIWRPDITLYNTAKPKAMDEFADEAHILVQSNGTTIWVPPIRFLTNCKMNLLHWPFDTQECYLKLGSWTFHEEEVDLQLGPDGPESSIQVMSHEGHSFPNNTEWVIVSASAVRTSKKYTCCEENYVDVTYNFKMARKYATYAYTVIFPVMMISVINIMSFLLPTLELSRIILSCFNFLTITAYMIYFRLRLPTIDHVPHIVKLFGWNLFVTAVNLILTIILTLYTNWCFRNRNPLKAEWVKSILDSGVGKFLCLGQRLESEKQLAVQSEEKNGDSHLDSCEQRDLMKAKKDLNLTTALIDRSAFIIFGVLTIVMLFYHLL